MKIMEACIHCDEIALPPIYQEFDQSRLGPFCCQGCLTVYQVLHEKGLGDYYTIKKNSSLFKRRSPAEIKETSFSYLDDEKFRSEFSFKSSPPSRHVEELSLPTMQFYLEGIHCLACLWLIEKLPEIVEGVYSSKLDLEKSVVTVILKPNGCFSEVAKELNHLGYRPHALKRNQSTHLLKLKEERKSLLRIGIAGAAAGNIMLYSVSLYGGASGEFADLFHLLTVLFAIPVLTFSAFPFYQNAWNALKNKTLSIDIPISLSLFVGGLMGIYHLFIGVSENYFDSLSTLVFLLLLSRYFLQKIQDRGMTASDLHFFYQSQSVLRKQNGKDEFTEIHPQSIQVGDLLKIRPNDFIPADGVIVKGVSQLNNSLLTGESLPVKVKENDNVFSGTQNLEDDILVRVEKVAKDSRLGKILKNVEHGWAHKSRIVSITNRISKYFTLVVFILSVILFFYLLHLKGFEAAIEGAMTLLIVTCPCALALAVPLTLTRALSQASSRGIIIKNDEVLEKLHQVKNIFIDKTGTITHGKMRVTDFTIFTKTNVSLFDVIYNLEKKSHHPVGKSLVEFVKKNHDVRMRDVSGLSETIGRGVSGDIEGSFYEIKNSSVYENGMLAASFKLEDTVRKDSKKVLRKILNRGYRLKVLTGDRTEIARKIVKQVGLSEKNIMAGISPERKSEVVKSSSHSLMIGDGANDAIALASADVGVAVLGAMDISLRAADVYLTLPGLQSVEKLLTLSHETWKVVYRNLTFSLAYNALTVTGAFLGLITPLSAAIIMPVSSFTVLLSTLWGTKKMRKLWKL